jgi:hypothetical protein
MNKREDKAGLIQRISEVEIRLEKVEGPRPKPQPKPDMRELVRLTWRFLFAAVLAPVFTLVILPKG